jgi:phosphatidylglycerophosphatase A
MMATADPRNPLHLIAFGFGSGFFPKAPGTAGTLVGIPLFLLLEPLPLHIYVGVVALLFLVGIPLCGRVSRDIGVHDHGGIVWDEIVGYLVAMTAAPKGWVYVVAGFVLFRLFDIAKPWPIRALDRRVSGGLGIMVDDLVAGVLAALVLQVLVMSGLI